MAPEVALPRLQRWFQSVVVHPGTCEEALAASDTQAEIRADELRGVILPSQTLTPTERLDIYHGMYPLRMEEALAADYPALKHFLGDRAFFELTRDYVKVYPSRSHTLNRLGDHLPEFLKTVGGLKRLEFCEELARLELAINQVFDAPETPALGSEAIAAVEPDAWENARLRPINAFRLLAFRYPVNAYLQTVRDENHDHPKPRRTDEWVAIYRRSFSVYRLDLTRPGHDLLRDLVEGTTVGEAVVLALRRDGRRAPREEELFRWFREWVSGGIFQSVEV